MYGASALNYDEMATVDDGACEYRIPTGIYGLYSQSDFQVSPVPFYSNLNLTLSERARLLPLTVRMLDMNGRVIKERSMIGLETIDWSLSDIKMGMYLLRISSKGELLFAQKVIKGN